ncbi:cellulose-binding domain-containing protein [Couchioplanes caeruleus]|uniref:cellulose binding domain-containing protein n=1 Tax=Couchioplanes caeruleus TaxID=56438 RepID=UPI0020BF2CBF|nr:cellulose binding domain-containing protein [Couchioplanes caeruleus]UQU63897.1 cellulose-binding domain-containing protein [Couchioplanes caeruleus]
MPGKHSTGQLGLPRYSFIAAAATLLVILVAWVAVRAAGPSQEQKAPVLVVPPSTPVVEVGATLPAPASSSPSASPSASPSRTPSASPTPSPSRTSAKPSARATTKPPVRTTTTPPPAVASFTARYQSGASWDHGLIAAVQVTNTGAAAGTWRVTISFDSRAGVRVTNVWNAQVSHNGDTWAFTGGPVAAGADASFGFQATKQTRGSARPTACSIGGTPCTGG